MVNWTVGGQVVRDPEVIRALERLKGNSADPVIQQILGDNKIESQEEAARLMGQVGAESFNGIENLRAAFRAKFGGDLFQSPGILGRPPRGEKLPTSLEDAQAWFNDKFSNKEDLVWGYSNGDLQSRYLWWRLDNNRSELNPADEARFQRWIVERVVEGVRELKDGGMLTRNRHPDSSIRALYEAVQARNQEVAWAVQEVIVHRDQAWIESSEQLFDGAKIDVTSRASSDEDPTRFSVGLRVQAKDGRALNGTLQQPIRIEGVMVRGPFTFIDDSGTRHLVPPRALTRIITELARQEGKGAPFVPSDNLMKPREAALTLFLAGG